MTCDHDLLDTFEISPRFRRSLEDRIARLDQGAAFDQAQLAHLSEPDHIRRQRRLIAMQHEEALRLRVFLDCARTRLPAPLIELPRHTL